MQTETSALTQRPRHLFGLSPWLVVGVSVILGLAIIFLSLQGSEREKQKMHDNLLDRANALIWALEAGTRTWLGYQGEQNLLQPLIVETAKQPGIVYLAVAAFDGTILAHSDPAQIGKRLPDDTLPSRDQIDSIDWRAANSPESPVFTIYRLFAPIREDHRGRGMHHGMGMGMGRGMRSSRSAPVPEQENLVVVALDQKPFQEALAADFHNTVLSGLIVAALGLGGFISMFWAHNYRRSNRLLMDARALASEVITSLPLGLLTSDADGNVETVNAAALAMLNDGKRIPAGTSLGDIAALDWAPIVAELARGGKVLERETELATAAGRRLPIRLSASQIRNADGLFLGHIFILGDIGEVKRLQSEVQRNERLTALGNLAAGVAHEIRNPLSTIKGLATYIARKLPAGGREEEAAKTMIVEVNRLNAVVSELLEFARPNVVKGSDSDVNAVIERALRLADADLKDKRIAVTFEPAAATPPLRLNAERLTQALLNLFLNAVQAMPAEGTLRVATRARPDADEFDIVVADSGAGMTDEVRAAIFNPYFTTKPSGTGLGLAIVHQIVEGHGGTVSVTSRPGEGSVFTIHLPIDAGVPTATNAGKER